MNHPTTRVRSGFVAVFGAALLTYGVLALAPASSIVPGAVARLLRAHTQHEFGDTLATRVLEFAMIVSSLGFPAIGLVCGIGLLRGRTWAKPWTLMLALGMAGALAYGLSNWGWEPVQNRLHGTAWLSQAAVVFQMATPLVFLPAAIVLVASRSVLGPADRRSWIAAVVTVVAMHATMVTQNWVAARRFAAMREQPWDPTRAVEAGTGRIVIVPTVDGQAFRIPDAAVKVLLSDTRADVNHPQAGYGDREVDARLSHGEIVLDEVPTALYRVSGRSTRTPTTRPAWPATTSPRTEGTTARIHSTIRCRGTARRSVARCR